MLQNALEICLGIVLAEIIVAISFILFILLAYAIVFVSEKILDTVKDTKISNR